MREQISPASIVDPVVVIHDSQKHMTQVKLQLYYNWPASIADPRDEIYFNLFHIYFMLIWWSMDILWWHFHVGSELWW